MLEILRTFMDLSESWNNKIAVLKRHLEVFEGTYKGFLKYEFGCEITKKEYIKPE